MQTLSANCHREPSRQLVRPSKLMLLLTTFMLAAGIPSALATRFIPMPPVFATGGVPQQVVPADVNGDGIADLITSNANGVVSVLLGKGGGSFAAPVTIATIAGGAPSIAVADFNGDGSPDLAISVKSANSVWVYLGHGDGTFGSPSKFPTAASPVRIAVGDVNGDGRPDLVALTATALSVLLSNGNGTFKPAINSSCASCGNGVELGLGEPLLTLGDVNRDGHLDVIVGGLDSDLEFLGVGDGHFTKTNNITFGFLEAQNVLADLNGDGYLDLIVAQGAYDPEFLNNISILWGNGDGTFQYPGTSLDAGHSELSIVVGDFNHDGKPDLAVASSYSNSVSILLNLGAKKFAPAISYKTNPFSLASLLQPGLLASTDLNGDGRLDLAVGTSSGVQILRNIGGGQLYAPTAIENYKMSSKSAYAVRLNGDAHMDLAVEATGRYGFGTVIALFGDGTGQFPQRVDAQLPGYFMSGFAVSDINHDGQLDLAIISSTNSAIFTALNTGKNAFTAGPTIDNVFGATPVAGDFNNDGYSDFAVVDGSNVDIYLNAGNGSFLAPTSYPAGAGPVTALQTDINKDGKRDLIVADSEGSRVVVLLGNGHGTFKPALYSPVLQPPSSVVVGDFNRDGKLDLAVACEKSVEVLLGRGNGTFAPAVSYPATGGVLSLHQTDLRHDDIEDLLFTDSKSVLVMYGNGNGTFKAPLAYSAGMNLTSLAIGDFNEDGAPDVVVIDGKSTAFELLFNMGGVRISLGSSAPSVHAGQPVTFTATVAPSVPGAGVPTGTVAFKDGPKGIGFVHLANGKCAFTTSQLSLGSHSMTASYWETSSFNPQVSSSITEKVVP